jgi:hypothetical protein
MGRASARQRSWAISAVSDEIELRLGSRPVSTVYELLGVMENDLTYSLGWVLASSPCLMAAFTALAIPGSQAVPVSVDLQKASDTGGYTDIEISYDIAHLIVEAKRGWVIPRQSQLAKYRSRLMGNLEGSLLVISEATSAFATPRLPTQVEGVPVRYLAWRQVIEEAEQAAKATRNLAERRMLREFASYLKGAVRMQDLFSNWTYCVSVSHRTPAGWPISFRDVVDDGCYFHPYGISGWPKTPPNYIAFRWSGAVQRIHHIDSYTVVGQLQEEFPDLPLDQDTVRPHLLYRLGPTLGPSVPLSNGAKYRAVRLWVALDLLLTSTTLKEALAGTKSRQYVGNEPG